MVQDKVTMKDLQKFAVGEMKVFTLPNHEKAKSAASTAYQMKDKRDTYGWRFKATIGDPIEGTMQRSVSITRIA